MTVSARGDSVAGPGGCVTSAGPGNVTVSIRVVLSYHLRCTRAPGGWHWAEPPGGDEDGSGTDPEADVRVRVAGRGPPSSAVQDHAANLPITTVLRGTPTHVHPLGGCTSASATTIHEHAALRARMQRPMVELTTGRIREHCGAGMSWPWSDNIPVFARVGVDAGEHLSLIHI